MIWSRHDAKFYCMRWSCFVTELSAIGKSHMVVALLYEMQSPCNCFTLSQCGSDSRRSNSWRDDNNGDQGVKTVTMVIMTVLWRWRSNAQDDDGHIISLILIRGIVGWSGPDQPYMTTFMRPVPPTVMQLVLHKGGWWVSVSPTLVESNLTTAGPCWRLKHHTWRKIIVVFSC